MEDETPPSLAAQLAVTVAVFAACGIASCFSGGLALIGGVALIAYLAATSRADPEIGNAAEEEPGECLELAGGEEEGPAPAIECSTRWREAVQARRARQAASSPGRAT